MCRVVAAGGQGRGGSRPLVCSASAPIAGVGKQTVEHAAHRAPVSCLVHPTTSPQVKLMSDTSVLVTPCGGLATVLTFLQPGATAIAMNYWSTLVERSLQLEDIYYRCGAGWVHGEVRSDAWGVEGPRGAWLAAAALAAIPPPVLVTPSMQPPGIPRPAVLPRHTRRL